MPGLASFAGKANPGIKSPVWDDKKVAEHHAIIPLANPGNWDTLPENVKRVYALVARNYVAQFYPEHEYLQTSVSVEIEGETFSASGRQITKAGWRELFGKEEAEEGEGGSLPLMAQGDAVVCVKADLLAKKTQPPKRFTEGTLQAAMKSIHQFVDDKEVKARLRETEGIGTSATRASILKNLIDTGYLSVSKKYLVPTDMALALIAALPPALTKPDLTALFEQQLSDIRSQASAPEKFLEELIVFLNCRIDQLRTEGIKVTVSGPACPRCGKGVLRRIKSKAGKGFFWGCSAWRDGCKYRCDDEKGKPALSSNPKPRLAA